MNVVVVTPTILFGEGIVACLRKRRGFSSFSIVSTTDQLKSVLREKTHEIVVIDVTHGIPLEAIRSVAIEFPVSGLIALGLEEQRHNVIRCGQAGFSGYVARNATVDVLYKAILDVHSGRLACSAVVSQHLLKALFNGVQTATPPPGSDLNLTQRESQVLHLIGNGLSNKEIARDLDVSVSTVKNHVHNLLAKMKLARRADAMRCVRDAPWLAQPPQASS